MYRNERITKNNTAHVVGIYRVLVNPVCVHRGSLYHSLGTTALERFK